MGKLSRKEIGSLLLAGLILLLGILVFVLFLVSGMKELVFNLERFQLTEDATITLTEPGRYFIAYEGDLKAIPSFELEVKNLTTEKGVELKKKALSSTYSYNKIKGKVLYEFELSEPSTYLFQGKLLNTKQKVGTLALGKKFQKPFIRKISLAIASLTISLIIKSSLILKTINRFLGRL